VRLSDAQMDKPRGHLGKKGGMACDGKVPSPQAVPDMCRLGGSSEEGTQLTFPKVLSGALCSKCTSWLLTFENFSRQKPWRGWWPRACSQL
jgi:hypothetical protein